MFSTQLMSIISHYIFHTFDLNNVILQQVLTELMSEMNLYLNLDLELELSSMDG